jgi:hypothetical protein
LKKQWRKINQGSKSKGDNFDVVRKAHQKRRPFAKVHLIKYDQGLQGLLKLKLK